MKNQAPTIDLDTTIVKVKYNNTTRSVTLGGLFLLSACLIGLAVIAVTED